MLRTRSPWMWLACGSLVAGLVVGCTRTPGVDSATLASYRAQFHSTEELPEPATVAEIYQTLAAGEDSTPRPVVLVGQVGGIPNPLAETQPEFPWRSGEASFFLVDQQTATKLAAHLAHAGPDHKDCPFCTRTLAKSVDSIAAVSFTDEKGKAIPIGAQQLFDLQENDVVAIEGEATLLGGEMLVVNAHRIHVRR